LVSMVVVVGVDLGTAGAVVAYVSRGVVDIVQNEVSQRSTPALVGFSGKERLMGDTALAQVKSNLLSTCRNFKHVLAIAAGEPDVVSEQWWSLAEFVNEENGCFFNVNFQGEEQKFSVVQVLAMYLTKLRDITQVWCQAEGQELQLVLSVPSYFCNSQRQWLLDAAAIAGLRCLRLLNENTATALSWGIYRSAELHDEQPTNVAFCSMGDSTFSVSVVRFYRSRLVVAGVASDPSCGGRDMDKCLMEFFAAEFKAKHGCDPLESKKARFKLEDQVRKTKKTLSANAQAGFSVLCLMNDEDLSTDISRDQFEVLCAPLFPKVHDVLSAATDCSGVALTDVHFVEIIGGASRIPWVQRLIQQHFNGQKLSTTLNADESVARGCALHAAQLSSVFKVRDFQVCDASPVAITVAVSGDDPAAPPGELEIFPSRSFLGTEKIVTFYRCNPFTISARWTITMPTQQGDIGTYVIEVPPGAPRRVKVRFSLSADGIFSVPSATMMEATDGLPTRTPLTMSGGSLGLPEDLKASWIAKEQQLQRDAEELRDIARTRNDLESFILTLRHRIAEGDKYGEFIDPEQRQPLTEQLNQAEEWLFDHMDDSKDSFLKKLAEVESWGAEIKARHDATLNRNSAVARLRAELEQTGAHESPDVVAKCIEIDTWLRGKLDQQDAIPKFHDPIFSAGELQEKVVELRTLADTTAGIETS